jgi:signal peptidase II
VIDFISLHLGEYHWPTFNIADASICIGAGMMALDLIFAGRKKPAAIQNREAGAEAGE